MTRGRRPNATAAEIAGMLHDGHSNAAVARTLRVSHTRVARIRSDLTERGTVLPDPRRAASAAALARREAAAEMIRDGQRAVDIMATLRVSPRTVAALRRELGATNCRRPARTVAETLALHTEPYGDGHTRWTGPTSRGRPQMWAQGRRFHARGEAFRAHHHRTPEGPVRATCTDHACMTGAHLGDDVTRAADARLDATYAAIFGGDA